MTRGSQLKPKSFSGVRGFAVIGLQQADDVFVEIVPPTGARLVLLDVVGERFRFLAEFGHAQVAGKNVVECGNVRRTLNRGMAAKGQDAAAGAADIAEQQLQDRGAANDLDAAGMLRPTDGIANGGGFFGSGCGAIGFCDVEERVFAKRRSSVSTICGRVARKMFAENWKTQRGCCSVGSRCSG